MPISRRRKVSQVIYAALDARDRYSASTLDLEIVGCRFEDHEIDTIGSQKNTIPRCASSCVYASRPISITKTSETKRTLLEKPDSIDRKSVV